MLDERILGLANIRYCLLLQMYDVVCNADVCRGTTGRTPCK